MRLQNIAKSPFRVKKFWVVIIYVIISLCRKCLYKHIFIEIGDTDKLKPSKDKAQPFNNTFFVLNGNKQ